MLRSHTHKKFQKDLSITFGVIAKRDKQTDRQTNPKTKPPGGGKYDTSC